MGNGYVPRICDSYDKGKNLRRWMVLGLAGGAVVLPVILPTFRESVFTVCFFRYFVGIPCPLCGLTRSVIFAGHLQLWTSLALNPLGVLIYIGLLAIVGMELAYRLTGTVGFVHWPGARYDKTVLGILTGLLLLTWCYNIFFNPFM
ncbi:MAG: DUF2752 domain-containing protein [Deltaproteobacteria bacterium]|nr:DUF2752 domain-containing protein [Deltaproteobacteria bacterium]